MRPLVDATHKQRILRAATLMALGVAITFVATFDPARAIHDPALALFGAAMVAWTVAENIALQQDEPPDYRAKRNTRMLQGALMLTGFLAIFDRYHLALGPLPPSLALAVLGALVILAGGALRVAAIRTLDAHFRYELRVEEGQRVVDHGVFRRIRHPSYLGLLLIAAGEALAMASLAALILGVALTFAILAVRIRDEERVMLASFGDAYERYRARSWRLVPFLY